MTERCNAEGLMAALNQIKLMSKERAHFVLATLVLSECVELWQFDRAVDLSKGGVANDL